VRAGTGLDLVTGVLVVLFVLMFTGLLFYFLTPEERAKVLRACRALWQRAITEAVRRWTRQPDDAGHPARSPAFVTWSIVILNLFVFVRMLSGAGAFGDPDTLVSWGGSFGPRTTNGEWWRLVTATFVHAGPFHLLATLAGLIQIGCITERLVGPFAFASVCVAAGTLANLVSLSRSPVTITTGGSGAVFGVYGLLIATSVWGLLRGSRVHTPWCTVKRLVPGVAFFVLYTAATGRLDRVVVAAALASGTISGLLLAKGAKDHRPAARRVAVLAADIAALVVLGAVPLRGMADVRPEIRRVMATEDRTATTYDAAVGRFTNGAIPAVALAQLIDRTILPELQAARAGLDALTRVPPEHQPLVAGAEEYLRLRDESWRLRSEALRKGRAGLLKEADRKEWQALDVLRKTRDANRHQGEQ
jgi:membrane associated rhomboid family serine protease